jgi:hypothetical protein
MLAPVQSAVLALLLLWATIVQAFKKIHRLSAAEWRCTEQRQIHRLRAAEEWSEISTEIMKGKAAGTRSTTRKVATRIRGPLMWLNHLLLLQWTMSKPT